MHSVTRCLPCEQRRQEASSGALRCALLRPGDGSDVIGSGPTHTNKLALPTQTFNNTYIKPQTDQGISMARKTSMSKVVDKDNKDVTIDPPLKAKFRKRTFEDGVSSSCH